MSYNNENGCILFNQSAHGFALNTFIPAYVDSTGVVRNAKATDIQEECFGILIAEDANTLNYCFYDEFCSGFAHGYQVGAILYLQDDGSLGLTQGTLGQKIFEVVDDMNLNFLKQPMVKGTTTIGGIARYPVIAGNITNVGAPQNDLNFNAAATFDTIGLNVSGNEIELPDDGIYEFTCLVNYFDNNSLRVAHRSTFNIDAVPYSVVEGENYMRDGSGHDSASTRHIDAFSATASQKMSFQLQTTSSLANTTAITSGWIIIKKL